MFEVSVGRCSASVQIGEWARSTRSDDHRYGYGRPSEQRVATSTADAQGEPPAEAWKYATPSLVFIPETLIDIGTWVQQAERLAS